MLPHVFTHGRESLLLDTASGVFRLVDLNGGVREFSSSTGVFQKYTDAAGNTVQVVSYLANGFNFSQVQRSVTIDGSRMRSGGLCSMS